MPSGPLELDHRAGEGPGDALYELEPAHDQLPQLVHRVRLGPDDHVIGAGDVLSGDHTLDPAHLTGDLGRLAHLGLDKHVCRHGVAHYATSCSPARMVSETALARPMGGGAHPLNRAGALRRPG